MLTLSNIIIIIVNLIESLFTLVLFSETCARQQDSSWCSSRLYGEAVQ